MVEENVIEEVRQILAGADRPLTVREVHAETEVSLALAVTSTVINHLVRTGDAEVVVDAAAGERRYHIAGQRTATVDAATPAPPPAAPLPAPPPIRRTASITARVVEALRGSKGRRTSVGLAHSLGLAMAQVSSALSTLERRGEVCKARLAGGNVYEWWATTAPPANADVNTPAIAPPPPAKADEPPPAPSPAPLAPPPSAPPPAPRYSYRSDGTLLVEPPTGAALELDRTATDRLFAYLTGVHAGVAAALGEAP